MAVDNATHYSQAFNRRAPQSHNFPDKWEGDNIEPPSESTKRMLADLRERFPDLEKQIEAMRQGTYAEQLDAAADQIGVGVVKLLEELVSKLRLASGRIRILEMAEKANLEEIERLKRTVKGLENMGGQQFFKKVDGVVAPITPVEEHLG